MVEKAGGATDLARAATRLTGSGTTWEQTVPGTTGNGGLAMAIDQSTVLPGSGPAGS